MRKHTGVVGVTGCPRDAHLPAQPPSAAVPPGSLGMRETFKTPNITACGPFILLSPSGDFLASLLFPEALV